MGRQFPYFYYDILARIIPGGATIILLAFTCGPQPGSSFRQLFSENAPGWSTVAIPTICLGIAYAIGVLYEAILGVMAKSFVFEQFQKAAYDYRWRSPVRSSDVLVGSDTKPSTYVHHQLWSWLVLGSDEAPKQAFAHAHRFQAESKMCMHLIPPTMAFAGISVHQAIHEDKSWLPCVFASLITVALLIAALHLREHRRWLQAMISLDELNDGHDKDLRLNALQARCQNLCEEKTFHVRNGEKQQEGEDTSSE